MPPRRRGKATTARAAAIQAVQRKRRAQLQDESSDGEEEEDDNNPDDNDIHQHNNSHNHHNHSHHHHNHSHHNHTFPNSKRHGGSKKKSSCDMQEEDDDDDFPSEDDEEDEEDNACVVDEVGGDSPPPLVDNDDEFCEEVDDEEEEDEEDDEEDDDDAAVGSAGANSSNTMSGEGGCLHCHKSASNSDIQVRCDECQGYICQSCHWCHEFQANHEIRVCDRCDAFYCRTCDEMDQCDDCGEVVCASCSTLLSCKFCGGGLCEECATACGRCGIVLCSRDAKFAVDCDTCRLSYCLVCLASGSKDPCVRCGHRPSKRMEQLVHLRLKSIYKAFKQSSRNSKYGGEGGDDDDDDDDDMDDDDDDDLDGGKPGDPQSLLQAAASAASKHSGGGRSSGSRHHNHSHHASTTGSKQSTGTAGNSLSRDQQAKEMVNKYMAEKEKADAAAEALLAELVEEETAVESKKNKKKRKKDRDRAKKEDELKEQEPPPEPPKQQKQSQQEEPMDDNDDDSDIEIIDLARLSSNAKKGGKANSKESKKKKKKNQNALAVQNQGDENLNNKKVSDGESMDVDKKRSPSEAAPLDDKDEEPKVDPIEQQLCEHVADSNYVGIEAILSALKGVPGRASLRKNAKKALKKIKAEQEAIEEEAAALLEVERLSRQAAEEEARKKEAEKAANEQQARSGGGAGTPATQSETNSSSGRHCPPPPLPPNELLRVVSNTQGGAIHANPYPHRTQRGQTANTSAASTAMKAECVLHMAHNVVGWVIGKGGQRIRDLMEDSGAKVWIDQEHLSASDPRIVYVSGNRKSVEAAVKMIKELVGKAPGAPVAPQAPVSHLPQAKAGPIGGSEILPAASGVKAHAVAFEAKAAPAQGGGRPVDSFFFKPDDPVVVPNGHATHSPSAGHGQQHGTPAHQAGNYAHEIACEACFVPLLIGRRGWTIKHIQDSSGARVDIDQTVTPRKVKISGREENVQTAIRMVRDVLSYPHAQLQGAADSFEDLEHTPAPLNSGGAALPTPGRMDPMAAPSGHLESAAATLSNTTTVAASNQVVKPAVHSSPVVMTQTAVERVHTPPPSSHIHIGDAKDTISASSSLSSTPEPSMASTAKSHYGTVGTPGPLLPPEYGGTYSQHPPNLPSSNLFGQQNNLQPMNLAGGAAGGVLPPQQHASPPLFPGGMPPGSAMPAVSPRYDMSPGLPRGFSQQHPHHLQQQRQNELLGHSMLRDQQQHSGNMRQMNGLGGMPHQGAPYQSRPSAHPNMHHSPFPAGVPSQQQSQMHLHQQSAFHQSDQKPVRHGPGVRIGSIGHSGMEGPSGKSAGFVPPEMWNDRNASLALGAEGATSGQAPRSAPADPFQRGSMPLSGGQQQMGYGLGVPGSSQEARLGGGMRQESGGAAPAVKLPGRDDSRMVDSLFGPPEGSTTTTEDKNILTGLQGLALDDGLGSDMWTKDLSQIRDEDQQGSSALFAAMQPDLTAHEVQHPSRSRFGWGTNES